VLLLDFSTLLFIQTSKNKQMDLLALDDRAEEYALSRRDGPYVALREHGEQLVGLTRLGIVHVIGLSNGRPVLLSKAHDRSALPEKKSGEATTSLVFEGCSVSNGAHKIVLPCEHARELSEDVVVLPDTRVLAVRWSSGTISELSPSHPRHPLVVRWSFAAALVRAGAESKQNLSLLWVAPIVRSDGRCGSGYLDTLARMWFVNEAIVSCCFGCAVTASGQLFMGRKHMGSGFVRVSAWLDGRTVAEQQDGSVVVLSEGSPAASKIWLDTSTFSIRSERDEELWGDNRELDWFPVRVSGGECSALLLSRPLRVVKHPVVSSSSSSAGGGISRAVAFRAAQLALHRAVLTKQHPLPQLPSPALDLYCRACVARRLDPPVWPLLFPSPEQAFEQALLLTPRLAALLLPVALHSSPPSSSSSALSGKLLAEQLRLGLLRDARDTVRFAFDGNAENPVVASHCRSLCLHKRPLSLLRLAHLCGASVSFLSARYCDGAPDLWELVDLLQEQLGLRGPVLAGDTLSMAGMTSKTRALLEPILADTVAPVFRCAVALLLLRLREAKETGVLRKETENEVPHVWMVAVSMCVK
jgi:hypothetical protein